MDRVNKILKHHTYTACLQKIEELEAERVFCGHNLSHFLDVARVAYLFNLESQIGLPKDWIYAAALLHDIGRHEQYLHGTPHHVASAKIAEEILEDCGFEKEEKEIILGAILEHRTGESKKSDLAVIICQADKMSRPCYGCKAEPECNWSSEKKNMTLNY